ncbi:MAG: pirin family protein [Acidobacteria bacterium]|uniref:Pirin family protein n=1 Tax=Candidatus Sulfomarinibacter kjeldsenii TaxID=2885994 RepID=A0A8J6Y5G9_9BACT|nr:pirin family protein [Candidatus Sulfomarinibacter kjeldsenii]
MSQPRSVALLLTGNPTVEGAGVRLNRVFGYPEVPKFDPFLLLDDFGSDNPEDYLAGFPWHPHRGIETVTYMLSGEVEHGDSLGNEGVISTGDVQWMTAGSGIVHQEMPRRVEGRLRGFQLWTNLPAASKMMEPRYRDVPADSIPEVSPHEGLKIKIIAGEVVGVRGPVQDVVVEPEYFDITLEPGADLEHPTPPGHTVFAYAVNGRGKVGPNGTHTLDRGQLALFTEGDSVLIRASDVPFRFLLVSGKPLGEPVAWSGPIVMNTREELATAFREYQDGTFIKTQP